MKMITSLKKLNMTKWDKKNYEKKLDTPTGLEPEKMATAIKYVIDAPADMVITEFGAIDIENF